jgi:hypothetical protein
MDKDQIEPLWPDNFVAKVPAAQLVKSYSIIRKIGSTESYHAENSGRKIHTPQRSFGDGNRPERRHSVFQHVEPFDKRSTTGVFTYCRPGIQTAVPSCLYTGGCQYAELFTPHILIINKAGKSFIRTRGITALQRSPMGRSAHWQRHSLSRGQNIGGRAHEGIRMGKIQRCSISRRDWHTIRERLSRMRAICASERYRRMEW